MTIMRPDPERRRGRRSLRRVARTIAELLAEWDAELALEASIDAIEQTRQDSAPLDPEARRVLDAGEAARLRLRASLADGLASGDNATDGERARLRWYVRHYEGRAESLSA